MSVPTAIEQKYLRHFQANWLALLVKAIFVIAALAGAMWVVVRGGRPQTILLFLITPTIRELIVATPLSLSSPSLPASRLLLPRSGLERSDFVLWPDADLC